MHNWVTDGFPPHHVQLHSVKERVCPDTRGATGREGLLAKHGQAAGRINEDNSGTVGVPDHHHSWPTAMRSGCKSGGIAKETG